MKEPALATVEQVYEKFADHVARLRQMRERSGEAFSELALVQLLSTEEFVNDLGRAIWGTDGHGRVVPAPDEIRS